MSKEKPHGIHYDEPFARRLDALLTEREVSQTELAKASENSEPDMKMTRQTISSYVNGDTLPDIKRFKFIADYFKVSYDYLLGMSKTAYRDYMDAAEKTGLSNEAISSLSTIKMVSEEELDESDTYYAMNLSTRRKFRHYLTIINCLLEKENIIDVSSSIFEYIDSVRQWTKQKEKYRKFDEAIKQMKSQYGEDSIVDIRELTEAEIDKFGDLRHPDNEFIRQFDMDAFQERIDYAEWRLAKTQTEFALSAVNRIMEKYEELFYEKL